jgi:hypothetical protein
MTDDQKLIAAFAQNEPMFEAVPPTQRSKVAHKSQMRRDR